MVRPNASHRYYVVARRCLALPAAASVRASSISPALRSSSAAAACRLAAASPTAAYAALIRAHSAALYSWFF